MTGDARSILTPEELAALAARSAVRTFQKGSIVISEGDDTTSFYAIKSGEMEVYCADESGREITLNILSDGEYFGELVIIAAGERSASVRAVRKSVCHVVTRADFESCLMDNPHLMLKLTRHLANRVRDLTERVSDLALVTVYGRVVRTLNRLATQIDGYAVIEKRLTHEAMARQVGSCREMVTRILGDLETGGYLVKEGNGWVLPKPPPKNW